GHQIDIRLAGLEPNQGAQISAAAESSANLSAIVELVTLAIGIDHFLVNKWSLVGSEFRLNQVMGAIQNASNVLRPHVLRGVDSEAGDTKADQLVEVLGDVPLDVVLCLFGGPPVQEGGSCEPSVLARKSEFKGRRWGGAGGRTGAVELRVQLCPGCQWLLHPTRATGTDDCLDRCIRRNAVSLWRGAISLRHLLSKAWEQKRFEAEPKPYITLNFSVTARADCLVVYLYKADGTPGPKLGCATTTLPRTRFISHTMSPVFNETLILSMPSNLPADRLSLCIQCMDYD
uniref:C2 domain-containing protein n=1 Tax=Macrostomum lignano TaxID=282301 RepID=A0A1I8FI74_9PLAT